MSARLAACASASLLLACAPTRHIVAIGAGHTLVPNDVRAEQLPSRDGAFCYGLYGIGSTGSLLICRFDPSRALHPLQFRPLRANNVDWSEWSQNDAGKNCLIRQGRAGFQLWELEGCTTLQNLPDWIVTAMNEFVPPP